MIYDAVVIGSGFGGAVSACRLAQAGLKVCVLERGKDYREHKFPRNYQNPFEGWLYSHGRGLYDVRTTGEMVAVQGAGYGGGSLVYANVQMRPPADVFTDWPEGYSRQTLDPYYDLVAHMLDIQPLPRSLWLKSPKTSMMLDAAERMGRKGQAFLPNLAINFEGNETLSENKHGAQQRACSWCGECDVGCSTRAKNTLDLNYLHVAEKHGAEVRTETEVLRIEPRAEGYRIYCRPSDAQEETYVDSRSAFLCAGAINSTELLLRCRDQYRTLPALSPRLGHGYSGNGDFLAFIFDPDPKQTGLGSDPSKGPVITTSLLYDRGEGASRHWFVLQEGGLPSALLPLLGLLSPDFDDFVPGPFASMPLVPKDGFRQPLNDWGELFGGNLHDALARSKSARGAGPVVLLAMGRDRANGKLELTRETHCLRVLWNLRDNLALYSTESRLSDDLAEALGGKLVLQPGWQYLRKPVSVHNLGGCTMGATAEQGVTSPYGEVHGYPNLFVLDGSILPSSTGVNPAHTIAAVAERNVEAFVRKQPGRANFRALEWPSVKPTVEPLDLVRVPQGGVKAPDSPTTGISFRETMEGFVRHERVEGRRPSGLSMGAARFDLTVSIVSIDEFLSDAQHTGDLSGRLWVGGFTPAEGCEIAGGRFNLFAPGDGASREMNYSIPFYGQNGLAYTLEGYKRVPDGVDLRPWRATTTLLTMVRAGHESNGGTILATGLLRLSLPAFLRQLTTFRTPGARGPVQALAALGQFGTLFTGSLLSSYHG